MIFSNAVVGHAVSAVASGISGSLYLLGHGYTYPVVADIFVISEPLACQVFNYICRILVARLYEKDVYMPNSDEEWQKERGGLIENNYEFPCVGSLDVFHI